MGGSSGTTRSGRRWRTSSWTGSAGRARSGTASILLVRNHMYGYVPTWSDAAVRRFIAKIGPDALPDLFMLREADNVGSGRPRDGGGLAEIRARVAAQLEAGVVLSLQDLAIDGDDLMDALGLSPSPRLGRDPARPAGARHRGPVDQHPVASPGHRPIARRAAEAAT